MSWAKRFVAGAVVAGAAVGAAWAAASPARPTALHAPAGVEQTNPIVSGRVVNARGEAVVRAEIDLDLLVLSARSKVVPTIHVSSGESDTRGRFRLVAELTPELEKAGAANDGWLNLDLLVLNGNLALDQGVPRKVEGGRWVAPSYLRNGSVDVGTLVLARGRPGVGVLRGKVALYAPTGVAQTCTQSTTLVAGPKILQTPVGELHRAQASAVFRYGPKASTGVDRAVMWAGGSWSRASKVHIGTAFSGSPSSYSGATNSHRELRGPFGYKKYKTIYGPPCSTTKNTIRAVAWSSKSIASPGTVPDPTTACTVGPYTDGAHKSTYPAGSTFKRDAGPARGFPQTVDLQPAFGAAIKIGSQSDYKAGYVEAQWTFASSGSLCGSTGLPGAAPRIFAGS